MTKIATNDHRAKNMTRTTKIAMIVEQKKYDTKIVTIGEPKYMMTNGKTVKDDNLVKTVTVKRSPVTMANQVRQLLRSKNYDRNISKSCRLKTIFPRIWLSRSYSLQ